MKLQTPDRLFDAWLTRRWNPNAIDLATDRQQLLAMDEQGRETIRSFALYFLVGEQLVTDTLGPILHAAPQEDERLFLSSQLADEAVHTVFFRRICNELFGSQPAVRNLFTQTGPRFQAIFSQLLADVDSVRAAPADMAAWCRAVTTYHLLVEGILALAVQRKLLGFFRETNCLPGFARGMRNIMQDESRHVSYGVVALKRRLQEQPALAAPLKERLLSLATPVAQITFGMWDVLPTSKDTRRPAMLSHLGKRLSTVGLCRDDIVEVQAKFRAALPAGAV